ILGAPDGDDEEHNCDANGCGQDHVLWRGRPAAAPRAIFEYASQENTRLLLENASLSATQRAQEEEIAKLKREIESRSLWEDRQPEWEFVAKYRAGQLTQENFLDELLARMPEEEPLSEADVARVRDLDLTSCDFVGDSGCIDPNCWRCHS